jgi:DNA-binding beta-propeller fold protein YncE
MKILIATTLMIVSQYSIGQKLEKAWSSTTDFRIPESALYEPKLDVVFVANMGEVLDTKTGDGFISKMNLEGKITNLKWVTGLNDPKGQAVWDGKLYVADMNDLVVIDIKKAQVIKTYPAPNAKFLNDVAVDDKGQVFVSDMKDQRIYVLADDVFESWLNNENLENVNGLWSEKGKLYAGNEAVWEIDIKTKEMKALFHGAIEVDGLKPLGDGNFIFSNWPGRIFISKDNVAIKLLDSTKEKQNTADIDYIPAKKLLLVPTFFGNTVEAYKLVN